MLEFQVLLFYKFVPIIDPELFRKQQLTLCHQLGIIGGRIIISAEGINGTLEGKKQSIQKYIKIMKKMNVFVMLLSKLVIVMDQLFLI